MKFICLGYEVVKCCKKRVQGGRVVKSSNDFDGGAEIRVQGSNGNCVTVVVLEKKGRASV